MNISTRAAIEEVVIYVIGALSGACWEAASSKAAIVAHTKTHHPSYESSWEVASLKAMSKAIVGRRLPRRPSALPKRAPHD